MNTWEEITEIHEEIKSKNLTFEKELDRMTGGAGTYFFKEGAFISPTGKHFNMVNERHTGATVFRDARHPSDDITRIEIHSSDDNFNRIRKLFDFKKHTNVSNSREYLESLHAEIYVPLAEW